MEFSTEGLFLYDNRIQCKVLRRKVVKYYEAKFYAAKHPKEELSVLRTDFGNERDKDLMFVSEMDLAKWS